jgi:hypothetical protein
VLLQNPKVRHLFLSIGKVLKKKTASWRGNPVHHASGRRRRDQQVWTALLSCPLDNTRAP